MKISYLRWILSNQINLALFSYKKFCTSISGMNSKVWNPRSKISFQIYSLSLLRTFHTYFKYVLLALLLLLWHSFMAFRLFSEDLHFIVLNNVDFFIMHLHIISWSLFTSHCWLRISSFFRRNFIVSRITWGIWRGKLMPSMLLYLQSLMMMTLWSSWTCHLIVTL